MISQLRFHPYRLRFKQPWTTHYGTCSHREGFLVELLDTAGRKGVGEAAPLPEIGTESLARCEQGLQQFQESFPHSSESLTAALAPYRKDTPALCCGLESALLQLSSQQQQVAPQLLLNSESSQTIQVNQILPPLPTPTYQPEGNTILKLKLGIAPIEQELSALQSWAATLPAPFQLRLDINQGWSATEAAWFLSKAKALPIESIEEPLQHPTLASLESLQQQSSFPIAIDESLPDFDLEKICQSTIQRAVLKPTRLGGPLTTVQIAQQLQQHQISTVVTSALESSIGLHIAACCAAAIDPHQQLAHGLGTASLLEEDLAVAPRIEDGVLSLS